MQPKSDTQRNNTRDCEVYDPISQNFFYLQDGHFCKRSQLDSKIERYELPQLFENQRTTRQSLRFKKINSSNIVFGPSGRSLTCKSDKIHEVDMNITYTQGTALWALCCSSNCLSLIVGVKNNQKKKQHCLQFTIQNTTKISFKLDISGKKLKAWLNKNLSVVQKKINLSQQITQWTPFIRVKGTGVNLFLTQLIQDPEGKISCYNTFAVNNTNIEPKLQLTDKQISKLSENYTLKLIDPNTLLLYSKQQVRLIRRTQQERDFNCIFGTFGNNNLFYVRFNVNQLQILRKAGFKISQSNGSYSGKTIQDWKNWMISAFSLLDTQLQNHQTSRQVCYRAYQVLLSKLQSLRGYIKCQLKPSIALQSDVLNNWGPSSLFIPRPQSHLKIPNSIRLNNENPFKLLKDLRTIVWTDSYLIILIDQSQRLIILNRQDTLFRLGQINMKKGFKKQYELNQYQKQLDQLQTNSCNEPSIYKILKNCLKYADKVKLPEKQKQKQKDKSGSFIKKENKSKVQKTKKPADLITPNQSLINTLTGMGFSQAQAKSALIQAKNSLQKAIQIIFSQGQKQIKTSPKKTGKWDCLLCTFINQATALSCAMCTNAKPEVTQQPEKQLQQIVEKQEMESEKQKQVQEDVESKNIQSNLEKFFAWELGFAYCPLVLAGCFKDKLRIRLFGPNPKYYSIFYNRDEQFVDLSNLTIHDEAHKIDQRPVRYQYYLNSTSQQQKEAAYGWISLEDYDIDVKGSIQNVTFKKVQQANGKIVFTIHIEGQLNQEKWVRNYKAFVIIEKVYAQKKKSIVVQKDQSKQQQLKEQMLSIAQKSEQFKNNSSLIPKNGYLEVSLARNNSKIQNIKQVQIEALTFDKINQVKPYLPIIASSQQGSAQISTLISSLQAGQKPLILRHLHNKSITAQYIVLEKIGKNPTNSNYKGTVAFSEDPKKKPVKVINFNLQKGKKKFYIQTKYLNPTYFVTISLNGNQGNNDSIVYEQLSIIGVIGDEIDRPNQRNSVKTSVFNKKIQIQVRINQEKVQRSKFKIDTEIINSEFDLNSLPTPQAESVIQELANSDSRMDLLVKISGLQGKDLNLLSLSLEGWSIITMRSVWLTSQKSYILEQTYKNNLEKFLQTFDHNLLDDLNSPQSSDYIKLIKEGNYNLTEFFNKHILKNKIQKSKMRKLLSFLQNNSQYFGQINKAGNLDISQILKTAVQTEDIDVNNLELVFQVAKGFPVQQENITIDLIKKLKTLALKQHGKNKKSIKQNQQSSIYGGYRDKSLPKQNAIYNRYVLKKGKLYRKYTIDLINVYRLTQFSLNFEKAQKKSSPMKIVLKSLTNNGNWKIQFEKIYPQFVWEQVAVSPFSQQFEKNVRNSKSEFQFNYLSIPISNQITSRYLQLQICFTCHPNIGSAKDIQSIPQTQILPEIEGYYIGQNEYSLQIFKNTDVSSLAFIKNLNGINKFNLKNLSNIYYYDADQVQAKQQNKMIKSDQNEESRRIYHICCIYLDELISKGSDKVSEQFINVLLNVLSGLQKSSLAKKIIIYLKRLAKINTQVATSIFKRKLPSQYVFNSIMRQSKLTLQNITNILDNNPNPIQIQNAIYFAKEKEQRAKQLFVKILPHTLKSKNLEETLILHEKHGWVNGTTKLLDLAIQQNKKKLFKSIISLGKENKQLADYTQTLLQRQGLNEQFSYAFQQLMSNERKLKQVQGNKLLKALIKHIQTSIQSQNHDESQTLQKFTMLISSITKLQVRGEIIKDYVNLFSKLPYKETMLSKFLSIKQFKQTQCVSYLIGLCINLLNSYVDNNSKNNQNVNLNLNLAHEIMIFIFRNQSQNNCNWIENIMENQINNFSEVYSSFAIKELCFGGESNSKIIHADQRLKLSVGFCMANLIIKLSALKDKFKENLDLSEKYIRNLLRWLMINENLTDNQGNKPSGNNNFTRIQQAIWLLLTTISNKKPEVVGLFKQEFQKLELQINRIKNKVYRKIYEKKMLNMSVKYLQRVGAEQISEKLIQQMFGRFFSRIINSDTHQLEVFSETDHNNGKSSVLVQKQYANSFQTEKQLTNKPKDWLIYKNGAKNSVFKFDYPKGPHQSYQLILKLNNNQQINLSKIVIGFQQVQTTQQSYCIPREISVEGGRKINQMKFIGKLVEIPDNHYINYSVRVFGLNCSQILANKLSSSLNKYPQIRFIKISMRYPQVGYATEALSVGDLSKSKNFGSSINFLSIQGYSQNLPPHSQVQNIQSFIKNISSFNHKQSLKKIFLDKAAVKLFKDSLINLSTIMKNQLYNDDINKFIMRVCEVNNQIGNETIEKYLHLGNSQTCSKIVSEIILSNEEALKSRVVLLHKFINKCLQQQSKQKLKLLEPFLSKFCQITYTVEKNKNLKNQKIQLQFNTELFCRLIKQQNKSTLFAKYLCVVMKLQQPFICAKLDHNQIYEYLYSSSLTLYREVLQALVVSQKNARKWFMQNNCLDKIVQRTISTIKSKDQDFTPLRNDLQTLSSLCYNSNIKSIINKSQYNLQIFNMLVSQENSGILVGEKNTDLRESFVNFINRSVLGSENQLRIAQLLKQSLASNEIDQNKYFVGQVFLPILNSYSKTTLCMHPYDSQQNKILIDMNLKPRARLTKSKPQQKSTSNKFRLPTNLISNTTKSQVFEKIKQKSAFQGGNFNLVANHGSEATGMYNSIQKSIRNSNQSLLMLFKVNNNQKSQILGIFYREDSSMRKVPLYWNEKCIMFIASDKEPIKFLDISKQSGKKLLSFFEETSSDYEDTQSYIEKIIEIHYENVPFCEICFTNLFGPSYINLDVLRGTSNGEYRLQSAEYWLFEPIVPTQVSKPKQQTSLTDQILNLYNISFFEPTFESRSILRLLRYNKIYQFPTSITLRQLKLAVQIMKCRLKQEHQNSIKIRTMDLQEISNETTIQSLVKKNDQIPIFDILCDVNSIGTYLDYSSEGKTKATSYLPKRGIMKHFEEINGVTSMIRVIKKSIQSWKNKDRRQKWHQYVLELEKFSSFPHFFGMYLKDSETFDLLFKLLSGLPDTEQDKKWDELETKSTQKLLKIIAQILSVDKTTEFRQYAMKHQFFKTILERLKILTGQFKRQWKQIQQKQNEQSSPSKTVQDDGTKQIKKKKGVGYGNDTSSTTKWMKGLTEAQLMKQFEVIQLILNIIENFLDLKHWNVPKKVLENIYESALLPYLQDSLRAGTLLQIAKFPAKFRLVFKILKTLAKNPNLVPILMPINKNYHPRQIESLQSLIKSLENTSNIFLSCLTTNTKETNTGEKLSQQLAKDIIATSKLVQQAIEDYVETHHDDGDENQMKNILQMPLDKKYRLLLKDLRFDYIDMKQGNNKIKHHYSSNFNANYVPNQVKMIRLAQQLADISTALPYQHTNAVFVRCDKDRADFMQALIMGSNGTPYGHGAFLFDVYFDDNYPNGPPKVNLTTTGHGKVRFNPNLYACGKVCLSLLGTWRGSACENWDPKVSTLLQVLLSIQAIIMSQEIYFNEPGFQGQQGTPEGEKKNEAYSNIVRYCNIKFAMIDNMRNPPKGFEHIIKRHFYLKQHQIMDQCKKWLLYAEKRPANYIGLVNDHNNSWSTQFKKTKNQYKDMLQKAIQELSQEFKKLPVPSIHDITSKKAQKKPRKKKQESNNTDMLKKLQQQTQQQIDVGYQNNKDISGKEIDINDQKVKDRWSRYIGAMGIDAVSKQSKADILVFGLGPVALEVIKNLVLSGCRKLTIVDDKLVRYEDLSGGFFFSQAEIGKKRIQSILYKIRQLNIYVKVDSMSPKEVTQEVIKSYHLVFVTQMSLNQQFTLNEQCRAHNVKFTSAQFRGAYCRVLNDFGDKFEVLDKNGQEPIQIMIKSITSAANGVVTLLDGAKHPFEDGEVIHIRNVEGMTHKQDKTKSINGTLHKVKVINSKSFQIGDTTMYEAYVRNGLAKNIKTPIFLKFQSMKQIFQNSKQKLPIDENLQFFDFTKMSRNKLIHFCFVALDAFVQQTAKLPNPWDGKDAEKMIQIFTKAYGQEVTSQIKSYVQKFSFTCSGYLPPLGAYLGGFISQQIIKAITQKFKPLDSVFYMDAEEIIPNVPETQNKEKIWGQMISKKDHRDKGFQIVVGHELLQLIKNSTSFMIGSGAIGCQLLKNFAMVGLGTGEKGKITLTDPDHIENSNLNRQFLFREKHISKPKSRTAAASILLMNPYLKGHISALLQRVSQSTKNIFSNKFFESLTFVANALDNVAARRYVDQRCVQNKVALFQSGTLGPKGHIQVILPYKTQSYGSQNDPVQEGQIPHCTLKMFPQQTLHCVQWARDIFGKKFSLQPKAFSKIKDPKFKPQKDDIKSINQCIVMATKGPKTFEDCVSYAVLKFYKYFRDDIMQLMYTYPLDAKTKDGQPFWKLPKRPPTPIMKIDPENILHCTFIASIAVLVAKTYKISNYPKNFRQQKQRFRIGKQASKINVPDFVPSDQKAKSILKEIADEKKEKVMEEQQKQKQLNNSDKNQVQLYEEFLKHSKSMQVQAQQFEKDNDQNGHIDFIYSMANLRATNYKLDEMDWITTKLKAGRIVPALATTTTCVAGLQTLQICKYIKSLKLQSMRNSFLNLAVPSLQMSEPGEVKKTKISDKVEVNLWDRWQVKCNQNTTFKQVFEELSKRYELNPIGVLQGMSRIDTSKTQQGKQQFLNSKLLDKLDKEDDCIDIIVLFTKSQDQDKLLQNLPPVRLRFQSKKTQ